MSKVTLGQNLSLDIDRLIDSRLLIQANSGGGKSYVIRKLLEETHSKVQQIVLDVEGEFASLAQKFDYILAGKDDGSDVVATPATAEILARKLLELGADCIISLYELKPHERQRFVKLFCSALVDAPKELWHPCLVVVDEAHVFCPEKGQAEAMGAIIDLATRGRKREYACVLATQRISKLHKDAAAECHNKLIGRTGLDIDMKRAADDLGFNSKAQLLSLRDLDPGEFYAYGPAISKAVIKSVVGKVRSPHGKDARKLRARNAVATGKVKKILAKLADLPEQAVSELKTIEALRSRVKELESQLKNPISKQDMDKAFDKGVMEGWKTMIQLKNKLTAKLKELSILVEGIPNPQTTLRTPFFEQAKAPSTKAPANVRKITRGESEFGQCERKILGFLTMKRGEWFTKIQVGAMTGYSHESGGFNNALSRLSKAELIERGGGKIRVNDERINEVEELCYGEVPMKLADWLNKLSTCERKIYECLLANPNTEISKVEIGSMTGYSHESGGFNNALSRLSTLGLLKRFNKGTVGLNPDIQGLS